MSFEIIPWLRGRCEFRSWSDRHQDVVFICHKRGRWMVNGTIYCGRHKNEVLAK